MNTPTVIAFVFMYLVIAIAAVGGVITLNDQLSKVRERRAEQHEKKRELQADFAAFLKEREKNQSVATEGLSD